MKMADLLDKVKNAGKFENNRSSSINNETTYALRWASVMSMLIEGLSLLETVASLFKFLFRM